VASVAYLFFPLYDPFSYAFIRSIRAGFVPPIGKLSNASLACNHLLLFVDNLTDDIGADATVDDEAADIPYI
jgi:hypothetical protein